MDTLSSTLTHALATLADSLIYAVIHSVVTDGMVVCCVLIAASACYVVSLWWQA